MTRTPDDTPSRNAFEADKPGTAARLSIEDAIEEVRRRGGIFVEAVRATRMAMALTAPDLPGNPIIFANQAFCDLTGYRLDEALGQQPFFMNGPDTSSDDAVRFRQALEDDQDGMLDSVQYRKDGSRFVAAILLSAFKDDEGRTIHQFLSWQDQTRSVEAEAEANVLRRTQAQLRESEERQRLLLVELQHRVRNILAMIRSVARRTAETTDTVGDYARHLEGRISALARTQGILTRGAGTGVDLQNLIRDELKAQAAQPEQFAIDGPDVVIPGKAAEVLSLALHELATNSVKYGALSQEAGHVDVRWGLLESEDCPRLSLIWSESGTVPVSVPTRQGFGTELITERVPYELQGTGNLEFGPKGIVATIEFPLLTIASALQSNIDLSGLME